MSRKLPNKRRILFFQSKMINWYKEYGRKFPWRVPSATPYQKAIAEILLQRTKAETVEAFYQVFIGKFPSWKDLAAAEETELRDILKPIGLWKQRANSLYALCRTMVDLNGIFPANRRDLERLPGVGQYIASAILLFVYNQTEPLLDVNMQRVLERNFGPRELTDIRYDPYLQELSRIIVRGENPTELNFAVLDFAAAICKAKKPLCENCFLQNDCRFYNSNFKNNEITIVENIDA